MHPLEHISFTGRVAKRAQYEAFEFTVAPEGVHVRNCSHEQPAEHEYLVTVRDGVPINCNCPADERFDGACKHRVAVAIRQPVIEAAANKPVAADGGTARVDKESTSETKKPEDCDCEKLSGEFPCWECVRTGQAPLPDEEHL